MKTPDPELAIPLTPHALHILLVLASGQYNAYSLIRAVEEDSAGVIILNAGTLYPLLKRLLALNYIREIASRPASGPTGTSKIYRLTDRGWTTLQWELDRYGHIVHIGAERRANRVQ